MKVNLVIRQISSSGGTKMLFKYAKLLRKRGHEAQVVAEGIKDNWSFDVEPTVISSFDPRSFPASDIIIATKSKDVLAVSKTEGSKICHLCQGLETVDLDARIDGEVIPPRYQKQGLCRRFLYQIKKLRYRRKRRTIDSIYRLKTHKIAVSKHLKGIIEERYGQKCYHVPNGIDLGVFCPKQNRLDYVQGLMRIMCVGPFDVTFKGINDVFDAVRLLKKNQNIVFTRASATPITEAEKRSGLVDDYHHNISETEIAKLYRAHHILIAASLEGEGFGLPAIEAMASGIPCILTKISSYLNFGNPRDYCYFVNPHSPQEIADTVKEIINDPEQRLKVIARGHEVAEAYSLENTEQILEDTLSKILLEN